MFNILKPDYYYPDVFAVEIDRLWSKGIRGIICDIDNTIVPYGEREVLVDVDDWFLELASVGFDVCLVSNGRQERVEYFSDYFELPAIGKAAKPTKGSLRKAVKQILELKPEQTAIIGDQIFTDVLGGNRLGLTTVLIEPLAEKEFFVTRLVRLMEKAVFNRKYS